MPNNASRPSVGGLLEPTAPLPIPMAAPIAWYGSPLLLLALVSVGCVLIGVILALVILQWVVR